jgi:hypothetical protein
MPIPDFDHNHVLPPHLGNPTDRSHLSPYPCTILELCHKFSTSPNRIQILKNFVTFRQRMTALGIIYGFQWLDGSFMENIEASEKRAPRDLDVVTFFTNLSGADQANIIANFPEFANPTLSKNNFLLDHYAVDYAFSPEVTVEQTRYWLQLFTHNRVGVWKGILRLPLNTSVDDQHALNYLNAK